MTTTVNDYSTKIDSISTDFSTILDNFTNSFIDYYKNLDSTSSQNNFDVAKNSLTDEITKMYQLKATIMSSLSGVNKSMNDLEQKLGVGEGKINDLSDDYQEQTGDSSKILVNDAKEKYKIQYVANITMFLGIAGMVGLFYSFMKNGSTAQPMSLRR
jgi:phage-related protein